MGAQISVHCYGSEKRARAAAGVSDFHEHSRIPFCDLFCALCCAYFASGSGALEMRSRRFVPFASSITTACDAVGSHSPRQFSSFRIVDSPSNPLA